MVLYTPQKRAKKKEKDHTDGIVSHYRRGGLVRSRASFEAANSPKRGRERGKGDCE